MAKSMLSDILTSSIFSSTICKYLYKDEISNVYSSCKSLENYIMPEGLFIYDKVCLHIQPHGRTITKNGESWYQEGRRHREGDLPAVIWSDGSKEWHKKGYLHRENDLPAIIYSTGGKAWYKNGNRYRENDLPAYINTNGIQLWYTNGQLHREGDLPAVIHLNRGYKAWYTDGQIYREVNPYI